LPPALLLRQTSDGLKYFWVLDGHHRITAAKLIANTMGASLKVRAFVVNEKEYEILIQTHFNGIEPNSIREVRKYIAMPFGDANASDDVWASLHTRLKRLPPASFPLFFHEKSGGASSNVGFVTAGFTMDGSIWIRDGKTTNSLLQLRDPPKQRRTKKQCIVRIKRPDRDDFEIDLATHWDYEDRSAKFEVLTSGIRISHSHAASSASSRSLKKYIAISRDQIFEQSKTIYFCMKQNS
jgi:hypothetical protein